MDLAHFWNTSGAYQINQSLRFNTPDSNYLYKTYPTPGPSTTWTFSTWLKLGTPGTDQYIAYTRGNNSGLYVSSTGELRWSYYLNHANTGVYLRDHSAWYHIYATGTATTGVRGTVKIYLNGLLIYTGTDLTEGWLWRSGQDLAIGRYGNYNGYYASIYLAEMQYCDNINEPISKFAKTDENGAWVPVNPETQNITYNNLGFYLKFDPTATNGLGHDHKPSGTAFNWTAYNFSTSGTGTDVMSDTPTNNWCTLNPLNTYNNNTSNGNLTYSQTNSSNAVSQGTIGMPSGKWYWEINAANVGNGVYGITRYEYPTQAVFGCSNGYGTGFSPALNTAYINSSTGSSSYCSSPSAPSSGTYMFAFDADARKFWMGVNGTWYTKTGGSAGDPGAGTNELFGTSDITAGVVYRALIGGSAVTTVSGDINFGQRSFSYTPPTGFKALSTGNLPEPTIKKGDKYFDTKLYTGTGGSQSLSGLGFQPDLVWIKARSTGSSHGLYDAVRGVGQVLLSNSTSAEQNYGSYGVTSFNSAGFSVNDLPGYGVNDSGQTYAAWCWDANGAGSSNTAGTITSTVSANATAGFSIATYTGTGSNASFGHGLGVVPSMCIIKQRNTAQSWWVWHQALGNNVGANNTMLELNGTAATYAADDVFRGFTSSVVNIGTDSGSNTNGGTYVAYCFSEVAGYSKFGSYTGNGSSDGPFVFTNFKVKWLMVKRTDSTANWYMFDAVRNTYNPLDAELDADLSIAETTAGGATFDFLSNGFKLRRTGNAVNNSGGNYIFAAFAEHPFKYANAR